MMSATRTWPKTPARSRKAYSPTTGIPLRARISRYCRRPIQPLSLGLPRAGSAANKTWIGRVASRTGRKDTCVCQRNRKAVCSSTSGRLPTTRSSLRRRLPSQFPSQLRSLRSRSLGSLGRQRQLGSQRQRQLGSLGIRILRSLCRSHSHGLPVPSPEAFPSSPYRRRRTSPG
jgi:hypothetical protein